MAIEDLDKILFINNKPYFAIVEYTLKKDQIWKEGSGRSPVDLKWYGVVYNFTNLKVALQILNKQQMKELETDLRSGNITVKFYDSRTDSIRTKQFYRANYEVDLLGYYDKGTQVYYDVVPIEFVAIDKD